MSEKTIPFCTIFLVIAAFVSNVLVLVGNLDAAASFSSIGKSTGGWSNVGMSMAKAFDNELDTLMNNVTLSLTGAVADISEITTEIDNMMALIGGKSDASLLQLAKEASAVAAKHGTNSTDPFEAAQKAAMADIRGYVHTEVGKVEKLMKAFLKTISPALLQIGKWETSFGTKLQDDISQFGTTIDWVQKAFDTMMSKLKGMNVEWEDYMVYNTFNLFDPEANDCITLEGLLGAATMYSITAVSGTKGEQVFQKYAGKDGCIDRSEYMMMVMDPGLSGILATILRTYAEDLASIGGTVNQARLRPLVATSVVDYLNLVSVKNHTKVGWIAERLTNSSVPMAFTACVMRQLAVNVGNPDVYSTIDVGQLVIEYLLYQNTSYTLEAFKLLTEPSFWYTEGFLSTNLAEVVSIVGGWIEQGINATMNGTNPALPPVADRKSDEHSKVNKDKLADKRAGLLQEDAQMSRLAGAHTLFRSGYVEQRKSNAAAEIKKQKHQKHLAVVERRQTLTQAHTSKHLFKELLGGRTMSKGNLNPTEWECLNSGVPAVPSTLEFAQYLSWNCTRDAGTYLHACFKYSSTSSNQLDAFANNIQTFVGKTQSFLSTVETYSGQSGIDYIEENIDSFVSGAEHALLAAIEPLVASIVKAVIEQAERAGTPTDPDSIVKEVEKEFENIISAGASSTKSMVMLELERLQDSDGRGSSSSTGNTSMVVFEEISTLMSDLMALLPSAATTVGDARDEVESIAQTMNSIFEMFSTMGPEIFDDISLAYSVLWTVYFVLLLPLTLGTLWYGFWASGWMGGPAAIDWTEESAVEPQRPKTCGERMATCYNACCICCSRCHDNLLCFWSCLIIYEIIVLIIFIVAIVLCMLNGIKLFMTSSCTQIYMLDQADMCTNVLTSVKSFIETFVVDPQIAIEDTCSEKSLLMCNLISTQMQTSMMYTTIFSFASAIFQFQLVIESCVLHERAVWQRMHERLKDEMK